MAYAGRSKTGRQHSRSEPRCRDAEPYNTPVKWTLRGSDALVALRDGVKEARRARGEAEAHQRCQSPRSALRPRTGRSAAAWPGPTQAGPACALWRPRPPAARTPQQISNIPTSTLSSAQHEALRIASTTIAPQTRALSPSAPTNGTAEPLTLRTSCRMATLPVAKAKCAAATALLATSCLFPSGRPLPADAMTPSR